MSEMDRLLPGQPSKKLIRCVRSGLALRGIKPCIATQKQWHLAWEWAWKISCSYSAWIKRKHLTYPSANEITAMYLSLLMLELRNDWMLKLPFRAGDQMPDYVKAYLAGAGLRLEEMRKAYNRAGYLPGTAPVEESTPLALPAPETQDLFLEATP